MIGRSGVGGLVLAALLAASLGPVGSASAATPRVTNPTNSVPLPTATETACTFGVPTSSEALTCDDDVVADLDAARADEGVGPISLPTTYESMPAAEQQLVLVDLERVDRGLPPFLGLSSALDADALAGAESDSDPSFPAYAVEGGSNWSSSYSALLSDYLYVYDDGPGGVNGGCTATVTSGCWDHRDSILGGWAAPRLMGAADLSGSSSQLLLGEDTTDSADVVTWNSITSLLPVGVSTTSVSLDSSGSTDVTAWASGESMTVDASTTASTWSVDPPSCTLAAGSTCQLQLTFAPVYGVSDDATLDLRGPNGTVQVSLSGQGTAPAPSEPTVPSSPSLAAADAPSGDVAVGWSAPADGGSALTGYEWRDSIDGGDWSSPQDLSAAATSLEVAGPGDASSLAVEVAAANTVGDSAWSSPVTFDAPSSPSISSADASSGDVAVDWSAPADGGSALTGYQWRDSVGGGAWSSPQDLSVAATSLDVAGPGDASSFAIEVTAANAVGDSAWSDPVTLDAPSTPSIRAAAASAGDVAIDWSAPADGGSALTGYQWRDSVGGGAWSSPQDLSAAATSLDVAGPGDASSIAIEVTAANAVGDSAWSSPVTLDAPSVVKAPKSTAAVDALVVRWTAAVASGAVPVLEYDVDYANGKVACVVAATSCTIEKLSWRLTYRFRVRAVNAVGAAAWSPLSPATRPRR